LAHRIFVNYRTDDARADARGIYKALIEKFGERGVFMDVRDLSPGQEFDAVIAAELDRSDVLIAVIGKHWIEILDRRAVSGAQDLMREEIATALNRNIIVIPVQIDDAVIPSANLLPEDIRRLVAHETLQIRHKTFDRDVADLIAAIELRRKERLESSVATRVTERRVALVVGNGRYAHAERLTNPPKDAEAVANMLATLGFDVVKGIDLDLKSMGDVQAKFETKLRSKPHVALLFYAGHGLQVRGRNYLVPVDARIEAQAHLVGAVQFNHLLEPMAEEAGASLIFLDACRDNPFTQNLARALGETTRGNGVVRGGLARMERIAGTFIAYATAPDKVAFDGKGDHSPFTAALLKYMRTPGLSVADMMIEVRNAVIQETGGRQEPWDQSSLRSRFCFVPLQPDGVRPQETPPAKETADNSSPVTRATDRPKRPRSVARIAMSAVVPLLTGFVSFVVLAAINNSTSVNIDRPLMTAFVSASVAISLTLVWFLMWKKKQ
jgi:Caspase domain/TIR domain